MKTVTKIIMILFGSVLGLCLVILAFLMFQMYKPVLDASKTVDGISNYAMNVTDELVSKDVKVIGLGEATHGNKEFQELKLDVLKTLIRDNGVSAICFEMGYGEGVLINDYVRGNSDMTIEELFSHIAFPFYHTEEMTALIEWVREYNAASCDGYIEFYGFDIQTPEDDIYVVNEYIKKHNIAPISEQVNAYLLNEFDFKDEKMEGVFAALETYKVELSKATYDEYENIGRIRMCIDNVYLAKELATISSGDAVGYGTYRDIAMAKNVEAIYQYVGYPIMITGHNGHIGYAGSFVKTMGSYLKEDMGEAYFAIGTDYFKTTANIRSDKERKNHTSYSGDKLAYQAKELGTYYLRFSDVAADEEINSIVTGKMPTGSLGEGFGFLNNLMAASVRVYAPVNNLYDAMIFVYEATPFTVLE